MRLTPKNLDALTIVLRSLELSDRIWVAVPIRAQPAWRLAEAVQGIIDAEVEATPAARAELEALVADAARVCMVLTVEGLAQALAKGSHARGLLAVHRADGTNVVLGVPHQEALSRLAPRRAAFVAHNPEEGEEYLTHDLGEVLAQTLSRPGLTWTSAPKRAARLTDEQLAIWRMFAASQRPLDKARAAMMLRAARSAK